MKPKMLQEKVGTIWDREAVSRGLREIGACRPPLLQYLKELLDAFHGHPRSLRYYDILVGDWLEQLIHKAYATWVEPEASASDSLLRCITPISDARHFLITGLNDAAFASEWNHAAHILKGGGKIEAPYARNALSVTVGTGVKPKRQRLVNLFQRDDAPVMITLPMPKCSVRRWAQGLWKVRRHCRSDDLMIRIDVAATLDVSWRLTQSTAAGEIGDPPFLRLLKALLPLYLPVIMLEGFADFRRRTLERAPPRPKVLYTANALHSHSAFKLLAAEWAEDGVLLLDHQHGGGYGIDFEHVVEQYETRVSDRFYTWGWSAPLSNAVALSPPGFLDEVRWPRTGSGFILLQCVDYPRVTVRLHYQPMPGTIETMVRDTGDFAGELRDRQRLFVRPYPVDFGWGLNNTIRGAAPEATFDDRRRSAFHRYANAALVVHNYLGTSMLETLTMDIPTICFYDPNTYVFRAEAQLLMEELERVGILHRSGKDAARFINGMAGDPKGWWRTSAVQVARESFAAKYANVSRDWASQWQHEFERAIG